MKMQIGGQAVIEGIMMRGKNHYSVVVRKPDGNMVIHKDKLKSLNERFRIFELPILRGCLALFETLSLGIKALTFSANQAIIEDEQNKKESKELGFGEKNSKDILTESTLDAAKNWEKGRKFALVIGISKYNQTTIPSLKYAVNDAKSVVDFLKNEAFVKYDEVVLLTDGEATRENILCKINDIFNKINPQDTFFMYYSGHSKEEYLIPYNGDKRYLRATGIRWEDDIYREINKMEAKQKILIIDSCHSGALIGKQMLVMDKRAIEDININDQLLSQIGQGLFVITSSRFDETSWENDAIQHGYFTHYLIEGLKGEADSIGTLAFGNGDGYITANELYNYVSYKTNDAVMKDLNKPQHPRKSFNSKGIIFLSKGIKKLEGKSYLTVKSTPDGIVFINGKIEGTTPIVKKEILPGEYDIKIENKGYLTSKKLIYIEQGEYEILNIELKKSNSFITINAIPWGKIYIDNIYIGITPLIEEKIESGEHDIEILPENEKYKSLKEKVVIIPDQNNIFSWELKEK